MPTRKIPLLLDTDIGSDIDDAVCLAYLLRQTWCELLGVTTVTGDTARRAALAEVICRAAGRADIPIHAGAAGPLLIGPGQPRVPQYEAIAKRPHRRDYPHGAAIEFLRRTIRAHPHEVTLLAVGPLTNVALLFATDPEISLLLKQLVLMCGVFGVGRVKGLPDREWNARCDPVATTMVFRARPPRFISVGLDVTVRCRLAAEDCRRRFSKAGGPLAIVAEMAEVWFRERAEITFHDPLAAAVVFEPQLCRYLDGEVRVEFADETTAGTTSFTHDARSKPHRIAVDVEPQRFFQHYFEVVGG